MNAVIHNLVNPWLFLPFVLFLSIIEFRGEEQKQPHISLPFGKQVGNVEFDAVVRLNAPIMKTKSVLFIHYHVSPEAISYDILWAEPAWEHVNFAGPPMGLSVYVDKNQYEHYHVWNDQRIKKDISGERGVFQNTCNTYDMENAGFAYTRFLKRQLYKKDIESLDMESLLEPNPYSMFGTHFGGNNRDNLDILFEANRSDYVQFILFVGKDHQQLKSGYWYSQGHMDRMVAEVYETSIPVSGFTIEVKTNDLPEGYTITQLPAKHHKGGRAFFVDFEETILGESSLDVPKSIEVKDQVFPDVQLLRNAHLSNYQRSPEPVSEAAL